MHGLPASSVSQFFHDTLPKSLSTFPPISPSFPNLLLFLHQLFYCLSFRHKTMSPRLISPIYILILSITLAKSFLHNTMMMQWQRILCNAGEARDTGWIPGSERSPGEGNSNPLQYSCLENRGQRWTEEPGGLQFIGLQSLT